MIGIFDLYLKLDNPIPMNRNNLISILTYLYYKGDLKELITEEAESFLKTILFEDYDTVIPDGIIPSLCADWGEYCFRFDADEKGNGFLVSFSYAKDRIRPSLLKESESESENSNNHLKPPISEPFYVSPYRPYYWYCKYDYDKHWCKEDYIWNPAPHNCHMTIEQENSNEEDSASSEENVELEQPILEYKGTIHISHDELINKLEIYQQDK